MEIRRFDSLISKTEDQDLCRFYEDFTLPGLIELKVFRSSFQSYYSSKSERFRTYCLRDEEGKIQGVASFLFYEGLYEGHIVKIAVALDLRISSHRGALIEWSKNFLPVLEEIFEQEKVSAVFSMINISDTRLNNLFLRPRSVKRALPRYYLYRKIEVISLHGRYPWAPMPVPHLKVKPAEPSSLDGLIHFLAKRSHYRSFSSIWDFQSLQDKLHRSVQLSLGNFLICFDGQRNIAGCLFLQPQSQAQSYVPLSYSLVAHNFRQFLKFGSVFGWSRSLTKPKSRTGEDLELKFNFLSHIHVRNEDVFESLLWTGFESIKRDEFLLYAHCEQDFRLRPPKHWISSNQPHALYSLLPPGVPAPDFLNPKHNINPEIDLPLFL